MSADSIQKIAEEMDKAWIDTPHHHSALRIEQWAQRLRALAAGREGQAPVAYLYPDDLAELERVGAAMVYQERQRFSILPHQEPAMALFTHPKADAAADWVCVLRHWIAMADGAYRFDKDNLNDLSEDLNTLLAASPARVGDDRASGKVWHDHYYQAFMRWLEDDSTHWINDKDAAWQAWMYLHEEGLTTYPEAAMSREAQ